MRLKGIKWKAVKDVFMTKSLRGQRTARVRLLETEGQTTAAYGAGAIRSIVYPTHPPLFAVASAVLRELW